MIGIVGDCLKPQMKNHPNHPRQANKSAPHFWIIGHRGNPVTAPENTLSSFQAAAALEADMVEFDVTLSKDGIPVVFHDRFLDRTTNGRGKIRSKNLDFLKTLDAGSWFDPKFSREKIPTLLEAFEVLRKKTAINVEIKKEAVGKKIAHGIEEKVIDELVKEGVESQTVVSSFSSLAIQRIKRIYPNLSVAFLLEKTPRFSLEGFLLKKKLEVDAIHISLRGLKKSMIEEAHKLGLLVRVYTVNHALDIQRLFHWGVDGIFTDDLENAFQVRRSLS